MPPSKTRSRKASSDKTLSASRYNKLLGDLQKFLRAAETSANHDKVEAFWHVGERLQRERIVLEAGYHNSVLRDLASDIGVGLRNLQRAVVFHQAFPDPPPPDGLSWSHYRTLLALNTRSEREHFRKLAISEGLAVRQLEAAIRLGVDGDEGAPLALVRPTDAAYLYAAKVHAVVDGDTLDLDIDLGFQVFRRQRIRLAQVDAPEPNTAEGRKAKTFVFNQLLGVHSVVVKTHKVDLHGRYVGHVFFSPQGLSIDECFQRGKHLNALLVDKRHAVLAG